MIVLINPACLSPEYRWLLKAKNLRELHRAAAIRKHYEPKKQPQPEPDEEQPGKP